MEKQPKTIKEKKPRATNSWISFVKEYALKKGITYSCALSDPKCKEAYKNGGVIIEEQVMITPRLPVMTPRQLVNKIKNIELTAQVRREKSLIKTNRIMEEAKEEQKPKEINPDIISMELQRLILLVPFRKIKTALVELNFKGTIQTNKLFLTKQLLQNFNTVSKMETLINKLKEVDKNP